MTLYAPLKIIENGRGIKNTLSSTRQRLVIPYKLPALLLLTPFGITKTCLYNFDPLKPHFYMVKLGFTGVYIILLFLLKNTDAVLTSTGTHNLCFEEKYEIYQNFYLKMFIFWW